MNNKYDTYKAVLKQKGYKPGQYSAVLTMDLTVAPPDGIYGKLMFLVRNFAVLRHVILLLISKFSLIS